MKCKNKNQPCNSCGEKKCGNKHTTCHNADVVEVVRCKDCERRNTPDCYLWYGSIGDIDYIKATSDDFYCSYGERRTNNER